MHVNDIRDVVLNCGVLFFGDALMFIMSPFLHFSAGVFAAVFQVNIIPDAAEGRPHVFVRP